MIYDFNHFLFVFFVENLNLIKFLHVVDEDVVVVNFDICLILIADVYCRYFKFNEIDDFVYNSDFVFEMFINF